MNTFFVRYVIEKEKNLILSVSKLQKFFIYLMFTDYMIVLYSKFKSQFELLLITRPRYFKLILFYVIDINLTVISGFNWVLTSNVKRNKC